MAAAASPERASASSLPDNVIQPAEESAPKATPAAAASATDPIQRIKAALEARRKMMIVTALDKGLVSIDGDYLTVAYAAEDSKCKHEIEARDKRIAIEDACEEVLGRRLSLRASISGEPGAAIGITRKEKSKEPADDNPKLRALVDKFHGEIVEVTKSNK